MPATTPDLTGQRFHRLTVLRRAARPVSYKNSAAYWLCRCECGKEKAVQSSALRQNKSKSCGCYGREVTSQRMSRYGGNPAANALVSNYRRGARERGYTFNLSHDQAIALFSAPCFYCSAEPGQRFVTGSKRQYELVYNGIDRKDNNRGYEIGNVVPCCKTCNSAKGTLSTAEFVSWVQRIYRWSQSQSSKP